MSTSSMTVPLTNNSMEPGSLRVERASRLPSFLEFAGDAAIGGPVLKGWSVLRNALSTLEAETAKAGWISFFMAGKIEKTSFGIDRQKTLAAAMSRSEERRVGKECRS